MVTDAKIHKLGATMFMMCSNIGMLMQALLVHLRTRNRMSGIIMVLCVMSVMMAVFFGSSIVENGAALVTLEVGCVILVILCFWLLTWIIPPEDQTTSGSELAGLCTPFCVVVGCNSYQ
jgi:hypothetical protein